MALVKAEFAGDRRLFELEERSYECLLRSVEKVFGPGIVSIKFMDMDGDWITIDRSEELVLAFRVVDPPLRIQVFKAPEATAASPAPSRSPVPVPVNAEAIPASYKLATQRLQERGVEVTTPELHSFMQLLRLNAKRFVKVSLLSSSEIESDEEYSGGNGGKQMDEGHADEDEEAAEEFSMPVPSPSAPMVEPQPQEGSPTSGAQNSAFPASTDTTLTEFVPPMLVTELAKHGVNLPPQTIHGLIVNLRIRPRRFVRCNLLPKHLAKAWNAARKDCGGGRHGGHGHCHRMRGRRRGCHSPAMAEATAATPVASSLSDGSEAHSGNEASHFYPPRHSPHHHQHHGGPPSPHHHQHHPHPHSHPHPLPPHHPLVPREEHAYAAPEGPPNPMGHMYGRGRWRFGGHPHPHHPPPPHPHHPMHHHPPHAHPGFPHGPRFPPHHYPVFAARMAAAEMAGPPVVTAHAVHVAEAGGGEEAIGLSPSSTAAASPAHPQLSNRVKARFVSHLTFPDKAKVRRNTLFIKSWLVRNDHSTAWPENTQLIPVGMSARLFGVTTPVRAPTAVAPGETVEVSVNLMAPNEPGMYEAYFRLCDGDTGQKFGQRLWLNVSVGEEDDADERTNEATGHMAAAVALDALDGFDFSSLSLTSSTTPTMLLPQP